MTDAATLKPASSFLVTCHPLSRPPPLPFLLRFRLLLFCEANIAGQHCMSTKLNTNHSAVAASEFGCYFIQAASIAIDMPAS